MKNYVVRELDRFDTVLAALCGVGAWAIYTRTLAPDVLYGDSAELQTLAYTLGHTHSTGYPIYLLLARLVGLLPIHSPAWRVNFFSALAAALAVAGVYVLGRLLTNSRAGAGLAAVWLALSYTLWSQAVIAEVYAPGAAFLAWILTLTLRWLNNPGERGGSLFAAALLAGLGLGIHATTVLGAVPAAGLVVLRLAVYREGRAGWRRALLAGGGGLLLGAVLWLAAFWAIDLNNPPSSFINVTLYPSRSIWGLTPGDMDTPWERITLTLASVQWRDVLFAGGGEAARAALIDYLTGISVREFSAWFLLLALYGWWTLLARSTWQGGYLLASYGLVLYFVLNYHPGDQYVFFLSTYIPLAAAAGAGSGAVIERVSQWRWVARRGGGRAAAGLAFLVLAAALVGSPGAARLEALKSGVAGFVEEDYQFPVKRLREPRLLADMYLSRFPENAVVIVEWREIYAIAYLAYVEEKKPGLTLLEAMPRGNDGKVAASLIETVRQALAEGRPVYASRRFPGLEDHFRLAAAANRYVQVLPQNP